MKLEALLLRIWYCPRPPLLAWLLWPLSGLFAALAAVNKACFKLGLKATIQLPVPVVVVGNITVGGTGKTPLTIALARRLAELGWQVGIISRGYGGAAQQPTEVLPDSLPATVGDEPLLLRRATGVPVFVARQRAAAGQALLARYPAVNLLLCDDGLQHYALGRALEICVVDGARGLGNGLRLPAGPLRESPARLRTVNAVVVNGVSAIESIKSIAIDEYPAGYLGDYQMTLAAGACYRLDQPSLTATAASLPVRGVLHALVGIGNPERFFATLRAQGYAFRPCAFPDHHAFVPADLPVLGADDALIVTEKDAVKLAAMNPPPPSDRIWVLPVAAQLSPDLACRIDEFLKR
ncbi:tetraacyldisaccharide 4'-kinase [Chitinibacter sp. ZOR0017]|uniref:tetraacyldisaccharide 4'-kinase n=1 Tax=Chitinibacter sp. ZOR0017 TaxID=1339254 RepID=UPI0006467A24|nr:tetraacyldisaccharide 4'-kinase [Chitinibacter sp. ZOR0017]